MGFSKLRVKPNPPSCIPEFMISCSLIISLLSDANPSSRSKVGLSKPAGSSEARTADREEARGRLAHHVCTLPIGACIRLLRSLMLSMPMAWAGNHSSISSLFFLLGTANSPRVMYWFFLKGYKNTEPP